MNFIQGGSSENDPALHLDFHDFVFTNGSVNIRRLINEVNEINQKQIETANENVERIDDVSAVLNFDYFLVDFL